MSLTSRVAGWLMALPPPATRRVRVNRSRAVVMRDGVRLRTDHYAPDLKSAATVLIRTPYGRRGPVAVLARTVAERGFHVVVQSCRGTSDSGGEFEPMRDERADGLDTLDWLRSQPWYTGQLCTFGPSYAGFVQWAVAAEAGPDLVAMATAVTASDFEDSTYAGGAFSWDTVLTWAALVRAQAGPRLPGYLELLRGQPRLRQGLAHLPLGEADRVATGGEVRFVREWLAQPAAGYWAQRGHAPRRADVLAPILMIGGWQDIFLPWQLADYAALRAAGAQPFLTIGPWTHGSPDLYRTSVREAVTWFGQHTGQRSDRLRERPVRVHVGGLDEWREYPDWPPTASQVEDWWFGPGGSLRRRGEPPRPAAGPGSVAGGPGPDRFRYDPAHPTPAIGGPRLIGKIAGRVDNRELESRPDVLVYTSPALQQDIDVIGPVRATIHTRGSSPYFDVFVRLCDVDEQGRSWNVCDGLTRVAAGRFAADAAGVQAVPVELWPAAHRFRRGHRIRVQTSGGAHPRFARNPGTGEPLATGSRLRVVDREVFTGTGYPSAIHLPVCR